MYTVSKLQIQMYNSMGELGHRNWSVLHGVKMQDDTIKMTKVAVTEIQSLS